MKNSAKHTQKREIQTRQGTDYQLFLFWKHAGMGSFCFTVVSLLFLSLWSRYFFFFEGEVIHGPKRPSHWPRGSLIVGSQALFSFLQYGRFSIISLNNWVWCLYKIFVSLNNDLQLQYWQCIDKWNYTPPFNELWCLRSLMFKHRPIWTMYECPQENGISWTVLIGTLFEEK